MTIEIPFDPSQYNPINSRHEYPFPKTNAEVKEYMDTSWDFPPEDMLTEDDYLSAEQFSEEYVSTVAEADQWQVRRYNQLVLWNAAKERGYTFSSDEGQFWNIIRLFDPAFWQITNPQQRAAEIDTGDYQRLPNPDNQAIRPHQRYPGASIEEPLEDRALHDPNIATPTTETVHQDTIVANQTHTIAQFNDQKLQIYELAELQNYIGWWNSFSGNGALIDLTEIDLSTLTELFTTIFDPDQRPDENMAETSTDGLCGRCLSESHSTVCYPHGEAVRCDGCGLEIQL